MKKRLIELTFIFLSSTMFLGCEDRQLKIEQRQEKLFQQITEEQTKIESIQEMLAILNKNLGLLDEKVVTLKEQLERTVKIPDQMAADVDASRVYLKKVADDLENLRSKTVEVLDIQNQRITQGRNAYIRVLEEEARVLKTKLEEIENAINTLKQEIPDAEKELSK